MFDDDTKPTNADWPPLWWVHESGGQIARDSRASDSVYASRVYRILSTLQGAAILILFGGALFFVTQHTDHRSVFYSAGLVAAFGGIPSLAIGLVLQLIKSSYRSSSQNAGS